MIMERILAIAGFLTFLMINCFAQKEKENTQLPELLQQRLEALAEQPGSETDLAGIAGHIERYRLDPLHLNAASAEELREFLFLDERQIFHLLEYRENYGPLLSIFELPSIHGFNRDIAESLIPYITLEPEKEKNRFRLSDMLRYGRNGFDIRYERILEQREGYREDPVADYVGSPDKLNFRYRFNYGRQVRIGITAEKDPGEKMFVYDLPDSLSKNGFRAPTDFFSFHVEVKRKGVIRQIVIGDYHLRFGQGLTLWNGFAFGKSSETIRIKKYGTGISPSSSSDENRFFRGLAISLGTGNLRFSCFYSSNRIDGTPAAEHADAPDPDIGSLYESGLHRTATENLKKDLLTAGVFGGHARFIKNRMSIGLTGYSTSFSTPILEGMRLYQQYNFSGRYNLNGGLDYFCLIGKGSLFGEISASANGAIAFLSGYTNKLHPLVEFTMLYRNYPKDYQNLYSSAFSENSKSRNETGFYAGFRILLSKWLNLSIYSDVFKSAWFTYNSDAPSVGNELLVQADMKIPGFNLISIRYKRESLNRADIDASGYTQKMGFRTGDRLRIHAEYPVSGSVTLRSRAEYRLNHTPDSPTRAGQLYYQDILWTSRKLPLSFSLRYTLFQTDSWDERLYAFENDIPWSFSVPAYYSAGRKFYVLLRYQISKSFKIWMRFSRLIFIQKHSIGSGADEIPGNHKTGIKLFLRIRI